MPGRFRVLLVDDGELDDVRDCLLGLGVDFAHLRGGAVPPRIEPPGDLLVASTRRASLARPWPPPGPDGRPVRIAVAAEESGALRASLRQMGFAFLVRRPVHATALRLLLLHALYRGEERRAQRRIPLGYRVFVKAGLRRRGALLLDISESGCRLVLDDALPIGSRVVVQVPSELCGDDGFGLPGRVVRCAPDTSSPADGAYAVAVRFAELEAATRALLDEALAAHQLTAPTHPDPIGFAAYAGPSLRPPPIEGDESAPRLVRRIPPTSAAEKRPAPPRGHAIPSAPDAAARRGRGERRRTPRGRYARRVVAAGSDGAVHRVLIGRDLSAAGMRIDRHPDLTVGMQLRLALYDPAREAPIVVEAKVGRDDGPGGLGLLFEGVPAETAQRLEMLVASLPPVERLDDGETGALGTVLSEVL
jgi:hypothetical protein